MKIASNCEKAVELARISGETKATFRKSRHSQQSEPEAVGKSKRAMVWHAVTELNKTSSVNTK